MMYNDAEYQRLINNLQADSQLVSSDEYPLIIRNIPDSPKLGDIDSRVLELTLKLNADPGPEKIDLSNLEPLRAAMNWKSFDITQKLINVNHTKFINRSGLPIRLRVYSPAEIEAPMPCIVYFHGGGWIGGNMAAYDNICKLLAEQIGGVVVSVDYRLSPENKFPAGFHDCCDAVEYIHTNADKFGICPTKIGVCGDSAGANLAAVCSMYDRDSNNNFISFQALVYPCVNPFRLKVPYYTWDLSSYEINYHKDEILEYCVDGLPVRRCKEILEEAYLGDASDAANPYASPITADSLKGLAPAVVIIAEYDYLRPEGEAYARRLAEDQVPVTVIRYRGIDHGFIEKVGQYPQSEDCLKEIARLFKTTINK